MKYLFWGTPDFAAIILEKLIKAGFMPETVVCNPDRPVGRKKIITPPPTKSLIMKHKSWNIQILQPETFDPSFKIQVSRLQPDLFIVAAYSQIIPKEILEIPRLGTIGVHPSLLPKYRGSSPIQTAILNGDEETGVSLYSVDEKMDHGPVLAKRELKIKNALPTGRQAECRILQQKLADLGADLLIETLPKFLNNAIKPVVQDEDKATYTKKFITENGRVDLKDDPLLIERKIRALNPEPGVFTFIDGKRVKLLEAKISDDKVIITKTQTEGKKPVENSIVL
ncbi:MAG: methionyl-tRNA formyltransferase [Candidatus Paceibacterota bacterium]|jgi:methionyl-tRNA formyltransferase